MQSLIHIKMWLFLRKPTATYFKIDKQIKQLYYDLKRHSCTMCTCGLPKVVIHWFSLFLYYTFLFVIWGTLLACRYLWGSSAKSAVLWTLRRSNRLWRERVVQPTGFMSEDVWAVHPNPHRYSIINPIQTQYTPTHTGIVTPILHRYSTLHPIQV